MYELTGQRRYNPNAKFNGSHVSVHGATRHTAAALCMPHPGMSLAPPDEETIMELQQRSDTATFRRHYHHVPDGAIDAALEYTTVPTTLGTAANNDYPDAQDAHVDEPQTSALPAVVASAGDTSRCVDAGDDSSAVQCATTAENTICPDSSVEPCADVSTGVATAPMGRGAHSHISRNAWRKQTRRQGHADWLRRTGSD